MRFYKLDLPIFPEQLDRGSFVAYFLGGVVPLTVLGAVVERYVFSPDATPADGFSVVALTGVVVATCVLSLGSFLMLRRLVLRAIRKLIEVACYDDLTGLPNRQLFRDQMQQALAYAQRNGHLVATCFLDLDGFKRINDTLGHSIGDQLLREVSLRLRENLRASDAVSRPDPKTLDPAISRLGGDEFMFLLSGLDDARSARVVVWRVLEALRKPYLLADQELTVTASIGISVYPADGEDAETLVRHADVAMYWAKSCGRNNYQFFAHSMNAAAQRELDIERCLRRALEQYPFALHYQPIREVESTRVVAVEALLRWNDPELGAVGPTEFIPVAEGAGLIAPLGEWVLRQACTQMRAWQDEGLRLPRMSVNVSGHQVRHPAWVGTVRSILEDTGIDPTSLELEITESAILYDDSRTLEVLRELSQLGIGLALDDFGTGYSSLSYLRTFPIDRVKVDQSFIQNLSTGAGRSLIGAIITIAHDLGMGVVAEGVETRDQADFLREAGCDELQGHLFCPAVLPDEFVRFLEVEKNDPDEAE